MNGSRNKVFISSAPEDATFATRLRVALENQGFFVPDAPSADLSAGDALIAVLSPQYVGSPLCRAEIVRATRKALTGRGRLIPVLRQACNIGGFVGMLQAADFRADEEFEEELKNLACAIRAGQDHRNSPGQVRSSVGRNEVVKRLNEIEDVLNSLDKGPVEDSSSQLVQPQRLFQRINIVAENVQAQVRSMIATVLGTNSAPQRKIFISYARADRPFAAKLADKMQRKLPNLTVVDAWKTVPRAYFLESVLPQMSGADTFLPVLSNKYLASVSGFRELAKASVLVLRGCGRMVPLLREKCGLTGLVAMLEHIDFTDDLAFESASETLARSIAGSVSDQALAGQVRGDVTVRQYAEAALENKGPLALPPPEEKGNASPDAFEEMGNVSLNAFVQRIEEALDSTAAAHTDDSSGPTKDHSVEAREHCSHN